MSLLRKLGDDLLQPVVADDAPHVGNGDKVVFRVGDGDVSPARNVALVFLDERHRDGGVRQVGLYGFDGAVGTGSGNGKPGGDDVDALVVSTVDDGLRHGADLLL